MHTWWKYKVWYIFFFLIWYITKVSYLLTLWKRRILLEDKIYVIGPGPWLRPLCRDQERDFVQKSGADAIYWNINICRELLIPSFENFNGTVSNQKKSFFHIPENKMFLQTRGRRWWRGSCCASTQDELQTKVTQHFLE